MGPLQFIVKKGSQLYAAPTPTALPSLSNQTGQTVPPTSPLQAATVGATPKQAAMTGSSAQLGNATRSAAQGGADLATTLRRWQASSTQTPDQEQAAQQAAHLASLGKLEDRVPQMIQKALAQGTTQAGKPQLEVDDSKLPIVEGSDPAALTKALATVANQPGTPEAQAALADVNRQLGHDSAHQLTAADVAQYFKPTVALGDKLAGHTPDTVTVGLLSPADVGYGSFDELGADLGLPPGAAEKLTVQELTDAVEATKHKGFQTLDSWKQVLADPTASPSERNTARRMLQEGGATGVAEAEASMEKLAAQVQSANTVDFMGKTMSVGDALKDDSVKGAVSNVLDAIASDPAKLAAYTATEPDLVSWVKQNAQELAKYTAGIDQTVKKLADMQVSNASTIGDVISNSDAQAKLGSIWNGDEWGKSTDKQFTAPPIFTSAKAAGPEATAALDFGLTQLATLDPSMAKDLMGQDWNAFAEAAAHVGVSPQQWMDRIVNFAHVRQQAMKPQVDATGQILHPDTLVQDLLGESAQVAAQHVQSLAGASVLGFKNGQALSGLKLREDGSIDADSLNADVKSGTAGFSVSSMMTGKMPALPADSLHNALSTYSDWLGKQSQAVQDAGSKIADHGKLTTEDLQFLVANAPNDFKYMEEIQSIAQKAGLGTASVKESMQTAATDTANSFVAASGKYKSIDEMTSAIESNHARTEDPAYRAELLTQWDSLNAQPKDAHVTERLKDLSYAIGNMKQQYQKVSAILDKYHTSAELSGMPAAEKSFLMEYAPRTYAQAFATAKGGEELVGASKDILKPVTGTNAAAKKLPEPIKDLSPGRTSPSGATSTINKYVKKIGI